MPMIYQSTQHRPDHIALEHVLGALPNFLDPEDPRRAAEQIAANYIGGWSPLPKFKLDQKTGALDYPGDPTMYPWALTRLGDELLLIYQGSFVAILQRDGSFEVDRVD